MLKKFYTKIIACNFFYKKKTLKLSDRANNTFIFAQIFLHSFYTILKCTRPMHLAPVFPTC